MMSGRRARIGIGVFAFLGGATACQLILGLEQPAGNNRPPIPEAEAPIDDCVHVSPPPPPVNAPPTGVRDFNFWLAARKTSVAGRISADGGDVVPGLFGYDLDGVCSCFTGRTPRDGGRACLGKCQTQTCKAEKLGCDYEGGLDNSGYARFAEFGAILNIDRALNLTGPAEEGDRNLLFHITGFNGEANDDEVYVRVFLADGIRQGMRDRLDGYNDDTGDYSNEAGVFFYNGPRGACDGGVMSTFDAEAFQDSGKVPPEWTGCDRWSVSNALVNSNTPRSPKTEGSRGYVTNGVLSVKYDKAIPLVFGLTAQTELIGPIMTARIVPMDHNFKELPFPVTGKLGDAVPIFRLDDGVLSGRAKSEDVLRTIGAFKSSLTGNETACKFKNGDNLTLFRQVICEDSDSFSDLNKEFVEPLQRCDAASFVIGFTAVPTGRPLPSDPLPYPDDPCKDVDANLFKCP